METQIINLIKTDIHLCRLTEQLKQIGFHTDVLSTNLLQAVIYFLDLKQSDELNDIYYKVIEGGRVSDPENDVELANSIYQMILRSKVK